MGYISKHFAMGPFNNFHTTVVHDSNDNRTLFLINKVEMSKMLGYAPGYFPPSIG